MKTKHIINLLNRTLLFLLALFLFMDFISAETINSGKEELPPQCAQICVQHICELKGIPITLEQISAIMPPKQMGESMVEIKDALKAAGLDSSGFRGDFESLTEKLPVIAHMSTDFSNSEKKTHWVVVTEISTDSVRLFDGSGYHVTISYEQFSKDWTGHILQISEPQKPKRANFLERVGKDKSFLKFDKTYIYAGNIPQSEKFYDFIFPFHNLGKEDLEIFNVKTSCSCALVDEYKNITIPPGGTGEITVRYMFKENRKKFNQSAMVHSNDPFSPYIKLTLSGNGSQDVIVSPSKLDFRKAVQGEIAAAETYVISKGDSFFRIHEITKPAWLNVTLKPVTKNLFEQIKPASNISFRDRNMYLLSAEIDTSMLEIGLNYNELSIETNIKSDPRIDIPIMITVTSDIVAIPNKLFLGGIDENETINRKVKLESLSGRSFEVLSIDAKNTELKSTYTNNGDTATIVFNGKYVSNNLLDQNIIIILKIDGTLSKIALPINGIY